MINEEKDEASYETRDACEKVSEQTLNRNILKRRARLGVVIMVLQTVVLQFMELGGTVVLPRLLTPAEFGIFGIVVFTIGFLQFFGDAGLGGSLIQKKDTPTQRELSTVFFLQMGIAIVLLLIIFFGASEIREIWFDLPENAEWLFRTLSLSFILTVLRVNPSILMERQLLFGRLAVLDVVGTFAFFGFAMSLAYLGFGVWALVVGTLARSLATTISALIMRPWFPSLMFDLKAIKPIIRFGIPYQAKHVINLFNGAVAPFYAGSRLGSRALGFIEWAMRTANFPLKLVLIVSRVTFPLFTRIQDDPKAFAEILGRSIQICAFGTFFFVGLFLGLGPQIIHIIFTDKWMPALPIFYIFTAAISIGFFAPIVGTAFDAMGKPQIMAKVSFGWTILNWLVVIFATPRWGMVGFVGGYVVHVVVGNIVVLIIMTYLIPGTRLFRRMAAPIIAGGVVFGVGISLSRFVEGIPSFIGVIFACLVAYVATLCALDWGGIRDAIALVPLSDNDPLANVKETSFAASK